MKEKRCIKFEGYIYLPDKDDDYKGIRNYVANQGMGRLTIFDESNKRRPIKPYAFRNIGDMASQLSNEYRKRVLKRLPTKRKIMEE